MKNKDLVEIILAIIIVLLFSWIFYEVGYLQGEKDSIEWTYEKLEQYRNNN
jgi:hypothetical protein